MVLEPPVFMVDEVVGVFLTVDQAVRSVDPTDVATTRAYDAEGRRVVLRVEGRHTVLDVGASGESCPEELRGHLVTFAEEYGLGQLGLADREVASMSLPELVDAYSRTFTLPGRPSPVVLLVGLAVLVLGIVVAVWLW